MENFQKYLDSLARVDIGSPESVIEFAKTLEIQAAQSEFALAIIAPTWLMSNRDKFEDFVSDFEDPELRAVALRDFACVPVYSANPFFKNPGIIFAKAQPGKQCPIEDDLTISEIIPFFPQLGATYFLAADLSVNSDSLGLAMVFKNPTMDDVIELAFTKQIKVSKDSEADYLAVTNLVRMLSARNFKIGGVGFDQYQSHSSKQDLENVGFAVTIVTYRDSIACCRTVKDRLIIGKLLYRECDEVFIGEAAELQVVNNRRIDHLASGGVFNSKDVWDAVVNATFLCLESVPDFSPEYD